MQQSVLLHADAGMGLTVDTAAETVASRQTVLSYEELYNLYATDVLRVCYFYLRNREQAEDVCQDVYVRLYTNNPQLIAGKEKQWLLKVAMNRCRDIWRSSWVKRVVLGSPGFELYPAADDIAHTAERIALMDAINQLPPHLKETTLLFYYQRLSIEEISKVLDVPSGTVSSRLNRAKGRLQRFFQDDAEGGKTNV